MSYRILRTAFPSKNRIDVFLAKTLPAMLMAGACLVLSGCWNANGTAPSGVALTADTGTVVRTSEPSDLPSNKHGELIRQGYLIFTKTSQNARRFTGNSLSCSNCHLDAGKRPNAAPMWAAWGMYPAYSAKTDRVTSLDERIQECFRFSLNGFPPALDSQEIKALTAYVQWISRGYKAGVEQAGRGFPTVPRTGSDPDPYRGRALYATRCASCHGTHGQGLESPDGELVYPALWGHDSFNKGAGFNRIDLLAGFLKANMPYGKADLSDQDALDLAAWIGLQERWPDPRKGLIAGLLDR
jgi:thiosulfate dehydrogenase